MLKDVIVDVDIVIVDVDIDEGTNVDVDVEKRAQCWMDWGPVGFFQRQPLFVLGAGSKVVTHVKLGSRWGHWRWRLILLVAAIFNVLGASGHIFP